MPLDPIFAGLLASMPPIVEQGESPHQVRQRLAELVGNPALAALAPQVGEVTDTEVDGVDGPLAARIYRPDGDDDGDGGPRPTVLFFHGGGFAIGNIATHDLFCRELCNRVAAVVVSVEYRLAPEHPFPAGVEDGVAAARWVGEHVADLGGDPERIAVAGDSAGGTIAAVVSHVFAEDSAAPKIAAQLLIYPATDFSQDYPSREQYAKGYFLDQAALEWFAVAYITDLGLLDDPRLSPLKYPKPELLPPTVVVTAEFDPIRDQGEAYASALEQAGVDVTSRRFDGLIHGFIHFGPFIPSAQAAVVETCSLLRQTLAR